MISAFNCTRTKNKNQWMIIAYTDFIDFTVDRSPHKQGRFLPGSRIPIYAPERIKEEKPDYLFILPWNLTSEIRAQNAYIHEWGGTFVTAVPSLSVFS